jgi:hypothetical protein
MRLFFLASLIWLAPGCGDDCTVDTACSPGSGNHYQFCNGGKADDCYYLTGDGAKLHCVTCGDCANAQSQVADWCEAQPDKPSGGNSNVSLSGACTTATCPDGNTTYEFCASQTATGCGYRGSDGTVFACSSCTDCNNAASQIVSWCQGGGGNSTTTTTNGSDSACKTSGDCQTCCAGLHSAGATAYRNLYVACACPLCNSQCGGASQCASNTADCIQCLTNAAQTTCQQALSSGCGNNADCDDFVQCAAQCTT